MKYGLCVVWMCQCRLITWNKGAAVLGEADGQGCVCVGARLCVDGGEAVREWGRGCAWMGARLCVGEGEAVRGWGRGTGRKQETSVLPLSFTVNLKLL